MSTTWARVAAYIAPNDPYAAGYREVIEHLGLHVEYLDSVMATDMNRTAVLILCGEGSLPKNEAQGIEAWINNGGQLVVSGSTWDLCDILGLGSESSHISTGIATPCRQDQLWPEGRTQARFFGGKAASVPSATPIVKNEKGQCLVSRQSHGHGQAVFVGIHVGQTLIQTQMGRSVECDGIGPSDGSARLDDGLLCAEDGIALPFEDREQNPAYPIFSIAHADIIKEIFIRACLGAIQSSSQVVAIPWFWPENADAAACLSLECDSYDIDPVVSVHRSLSMYGMPAAWTVSLPGFPAEVYRTIRARDHEVSLLFNFEDATHWNEERLRSQMTQLTRMSSDTGLTSVRPIRGGWRGWTKFYDMCEAAGARLSLSKGGRQPGTQGFCFGTCHPFFPLRPDGHPGLVLELPYHLFRPGVVTKDEIIEPIVKEVAERHGCLHIVSCPEDFKNQITSMVLQRVFGIAKQYHLVFMSPAEIYQYERSRRQLRWTTRSLSGELTVSVASENELEGFSLIVNHEFKSVFINGKVANFKIIERFGIKFFAVQFDLRPKQAVEIRFDVSQAEAA